MHANLARESAPEASREPISERRLAWETLRERDLEEKMGQGAAHGSAVKRFVDALLALTEARGHKAYVGWDVFIEWDPNDPSARVSPDAFLLDGQAPTIAPSIWQTWEPGCDPPRFALEVVSKRSRKKDYDVSPARYAALGAEELAVFDAKPRGPRGVPLQLFRRSPRGQFLRVYAGPGPVESAVLGAWLVVTDGGKRLRLANSADPDDLVATADEQVILERERAKVAEGAAMLERERAKAAEGAAMLERERAKEAEARAAAAEARLRELEARLARGA